MTRRTARVPRMRQEQPVDEDRGDPDVDDGRETDLVDDRLDGLRHRGQSVRQARGAGSRGSSGMRASTSARRRSRAGPLSVSSTYRSRITSLSAAAVSSRGRGPARPARGGVRVRRGDRQPELDRVDGGVEQSPAAHRADRVEDHLVDRAGIPGLERPPRRRSTGPRVERREERLLDDGRPGVRAGDPRFAAPDAGSASAIGASSVRSARASAPRRRVRRSTSGARPRAPRGGAGAPGLRQLEGPAGGVAGVGRRPSDSWVSASRSSTPAASGRPSGGERVRPAGQARLVAGRRGALRRRRSWPGRAGRAGAGRGPCWRVAAGGRGRGWRLRRRRPRPPRGGRARPRRGRPAGRSCSARRVLRQSLDPRDSRPGTPSGREGGSRPVPRPGSVDRPGRRR